MREFIFFSDFDKTLTGKDFYNIVIEKHLGEKGVQLYNDWKANKMKDIDFLNIIFSSMNCSEEEAIKDILTIPFDMDAHSFMKKTEEAGGEFIVLSAGADYYIKKIFEHYGIKGVKIITNPSEYRDGGIHILPDYNSPYYSEVYGVDKALVVKSFKNEAKKIFYAGDSGPDLKAAEQADIIFAKGELQKLLKDEGYSFIPVNSFKEIEDYFVKTGVIK
ncbi:MAG: MtnX-like HAD-IB family phosphatase [Deltaproteobacteria bacterium]